jgi:hypothetical protein
MVFGTIVWISDVFEHPYSQTDPGRAKDMGRAFCHRKSLKWLVEMIMAATKAR